MPTLSTYTVALDHGQFYLHTAAPGDGEEDAVTGLLDQALGGPRIARNEASIVVRSPHQNNVAMRLDVETWDHEPPDDEQDWKEVFTTSATITGRGSSITAGPAPPPPGAPGASSSGPPPGPGRRATTAPGPAWRVP